MEYYRGERLKHAGLIPDMNAERYPNKPVFFFEDKNRSYKELSERTSKLASSLAMEGIEPGDRVCQYMPNSLRFMEAFLGIIKAGAIPVPMNLRLPQKTLSYILKDTEADTLFVSSLETSVSSPQKGKELAKEAGIDRLIMPEGKGEKIIDYQDLMEWGSPNFEYPVQGYDGTALQLYTSGTTGKPKGVPITHKNLLSGLEGETKTVGFDPDDRIVVVVPLYHVMGLTAVTWAFLYVGGSMVIQTEPDPEKILRNIEKYDCNVFAGVPALLRMMWLVDEQNPKKYDPTGLENMISAAAPLDNSTLKKIKNEWDVRFLEAGGMTETTLGVLQNTGYIPKDAGCVGWPIPNVEVKIVDPKTRETIVPWEAIAPSGELKDQHIDEEGEIAFRGNPIFEGYYKQPEENKEAFDEDGWFYSGDIMKIDKDKALWYVERTDNLIISGGEKVYPSIVEDALLEHHEISESAVVPAPHNTKGEVPVAFVVQKPDADLTEEEIKKFALERVPTYAHPRRVFFKNNLPKSGALKIQHFKLEDEVEELLSEPLGKERYKSGS